MKNIAELCFDNAKSIKMTINKLKVLAIIPARGDIKSIKLKNLEKINNISLVGHSINHALSSTLIHRIILSTDHSDIVNDALDMGAEVPFIRPDRLSGDDVLYFPVFKH